MTIKIPAPNLLDKVIGYVSPERGLNRLAHRTQMEMAVSSSYASTSSESNSRWFRPRARSAAADMAGVLSTQRGQSRDLARNQPIAVGAINTNVDRVVGTGLALSAQPQLQVLGWSPEEAEDWKRHVQAEFAMFADSKDCDITRQQNFDELCALVLRSSLESGDAFTLLPDAPAATAAMPYRLRLQVLEADRVGNPGNKPDTDNEVQGVRLNEQGAPLAYHVYRRHPGALMALASNRWAGEWVDATGSSGRRRVLHHFERLRPEQPRGLCYLAPVIECIKQISTYTDNEIQAAVVSSLFTVFIKTKGKAGNSPVYSGDEGAAAGLAHDEVGMGAGAVMELDEDEDVEFANPTRPNTAFEPFTQAVFRQIGMALGLPHELLIKQFNASYSASKAALLDAWQYLRRRRRWIALTFCQPVYETWMAEAVATGRVSAPGFFTDPLLRWAYTRAAWVGDSQGSINPKDEVAAYRDAIDARLCTHERAEWELFGTDWNQTLATKAAERTALDRNQLTPVPKAGAAAAPAAPASTQPGDK